MVLFFLCTLDEITKTDVQLNGYLNYLEIKTL
jgi:hypothetical protein